MTALLTGPDLIKALRALGVAGGDRLLVHTRLSALGFVPGSARTVIEALIAAVGADGTIMMPTFSGELSDPAEWRHPPVPQDWLEPIREHTPAYDKKLTPTRRMGSVAELFRHWPGALRSDHPQSSFTALGRDAAALVGRHPLDFRFGPASPLGALRDLGGKSLLLGAPLNTNSFFYLTNYAFDAAEIVTKRAPIMRDGRRAWVSYTDRDYSDRWFAECTAHLLQAGFARQGSVGDTTAYLLDNSRGYDEAIAWRRSKGV